MTWASAYIERLKRGETVAFRPNGHSMRPRIESGQLCTVVPTQSVAIGVGDIVLCRVGAKEYLHLVKAIEPYTADGVRRARYQIGNNRGGVNGWVDESAVFGKCMRVEP